MLCEEERGEGWSVVVRWRGWVVCGLSGRGLVGGGWEGVSQGFEGGGRLRGC